MAGKASPLGDFRQNGDIQKDLAEYFLGLQVGERIPSVREFSNAYGMSVGAVSIALNGLEETGAVTLEKRGHMGSYLTARSVGMLWNLIGRGPMVIAMSLPMHIRFEGLATAVKQVLETAGIGIYFIFIRGSDNRLKALHDNRCHAVLMSKLSSEEKDSAANEVLLELPSGTWLSDYGVYYRKQAEDKKEGYTVGVDFQSYDHHMITQMEFGGRKVQMKSVSYVHVAQMLRNNEIDAFVWNKDQMDALASPEIAYRPLSDTVREEIGNKVLTAVFVGKPSDSAVRTVLREYMDPQRITELQRKVVSREILPNY